MVRYSLRHAPDPRPGLVVQTCERADEATIREFRDILYGLGCSGGLLFDPARCLVIRDTFTSMGPESLVVEKEVPTDAVLSKMTRPGQPTPRSLDRRVGLWLGACKERRAVEVKNDTAALVRIQCERGAVLATVVVNAAPPHLV